MDNSSPQSQQIFIEYIMHGCPNFATLTKDSNRERTVGDLRTTIEGTLGKMEARLLEFVSNRQILCNQTKLSEVKTPIVCSFMSPAEYVRRVVSNYTMLSEDSDCLEIWQIESIIKQLELFRTRQVFEHIRHVCRTETAFTETQYLLCDLKHTIHCLILRYRLICQRKILQQKENNTGVQACIKKYRDFGSTFSAQTMSPMCWTNQF